jgi:hypothetical protein
VSDRRLRVLVAVAAVAGLGIAVAGIATRGKAHHPSTLLVDEATGSIGTVFLGEPHAQVTAQHPHLTIAFSDGKVSSIRTDDPSAKTLKAVRIGDPLSAVRASYRKAARCNPNSPDRTAKHPICHVKVPAGLMVIRGDPVQTITLSRR